MQALGADSDETVFIQWTSSFRPPSLPHTSTFFSCSCRYRWLAVEQYPLWDQQGSLLSEGLTAGVCAAEEPSCEKCSEWVSKRSTVANRYINGSMGSCSIRQEETLWDMYALTPYPLIKMHMSMAWTDLRTGPRPPRDGRVLWGRMDSFSAMIQLRGRHGESRSAQRHSCRSTLRYEYDDAVTFLGSDVMREPIDGVDRRWNPHTILVSPPTFADRDLIACLIHLNIKVS